MEIDDGMRWRHCEQHGFPVRKQHAPTAVDRATGKTIKLPCWQAFGPGEIRTEGHTSIEAVDNAILRTAGRQR